ncbi:MAG TPA: thiol reductant ABC exporter subunit CydD [Geminicoccus sp.]|nr:thiol reductant ABC exporter subunit CydD [Geminicoccus sp.]HEX2527335.1 thiol reductant ABC exporter subunit CydD [Geminicoccus sp.]
MRHSIPADQARQHGRWMMGLRRHGGPGLLLATVLPVLAGVVLVGQAWLLADILGRAIVAGEGRTVLLPSVAVLACLFGLRVLLGLVAERAGTQAAERIKVALRGTLFDRMLSHQPGWIAARPSGALSAALVDHVEALDGFVARFMPAMVQAAVLPIAFAVLVLPVDWVVGLLFLVTAPLIPLFMALVGWGTEAATRANAQAFSRLSGLFADRLRGMLALKLFGRAADETRLVRDSSEDLRRRTLGVLRIAFLSSAVLEFFAALGVAGVALYVGLSYLGLVDLRGTALGLQAGLFCLLMAPEVYQPLRLLAAHYHDRAAAKAAVAEIAQQFGELPAVGARLRPAEEETVTDDGKALDLVVEGLRLHASDRRTIVLDEVDLRMTAGSHVALVGESGSGKTSLLEALARLRSAEGTIAIGGCPLAGLPEARLRAMVAMVGQRPRIFAGSIAENIRVGRPRASEAEVRRAADLALVTEFAPDLAMPLGENGLGLSGGEAHRVALARLFLRDPGLILLDEPTAHLDLQTEQRLLDNLMAFARGRTMLVATHSATVAARMDRTLRIAGHSVLPTPQRRERQPTLPMESVA